MDNKTTACEVFSAAENVSDMKKNFICANDNLHEAMLNSPLAIVIYAFAVLFIMFLVQRASAPVRKASSHQADVKEVESPPEHKKDQNED